MFFDTDELKHFVCIRPHNKIENIYAAMQDFFEILQKITVVLKCFLEFCLFHTTTLK